MSTRTLDKLIAALEYIVILAVLASPFVMWLS